MSISHNYQKSLFVDSSLRTNQVYLALFTSDPTAAWNSSPPTGGTECNFAGYARKSMGGTPSAAWTAVDGQGKTRNGQTVMFDAKSDAGTVTVTHWAIMTAASGGNMRYFGALDTPKSLDQGDVLGLLASNLEFQF